jgi:hypothetical protein
MQNAVTHTENANGSEGINHGSPLGLRHTLKQMLELSPGVQFVDRPQQCLCTLILLDPVSQGPTIQLGHRDNSD